MKSVDANEEQVENTCELNTRQDTAKKQKDTLIVLPTGFYGDVVQDSLKQEDAVSGSIELIQSHQIKRWVLLYCLECGASRWVYRALVGNASRDTFWLSGCTDCTDEFAGLYFSDTLISAGRKIMVSAMLATA